ncbi:MAG TPA: alternative ribosome rescue aminoacyl-tRNA hydrolase ArfB, partial [Anaerolineae bacterium]|nr:alternative ribosome rescue aminoacyl-tRNA hydrolase ArfB [Anaerolineae bacterium]
MEDDVIRIDNQLSIPAAELDFRFSRSSGPGGQHVQKSSTRVELLFDVAGSPSLTDDQRARISKRLENYLDADGVLHLTSQSERSQWRNRQEAVDRFAELLRSALKRRKKRKPT